MGTSRMFDKRIEIYSENTCPCINCKDRWIKEEDGIVSRCHVYCEKYITFQRNLEIFKEEQKKLKHQYQVFEAYRIENHIKNTKGKVKEK